MKEITEEETNKIVKDENKFQILKREEDNGTKSLVILKKFSSGFILDVTCKSINVFRHYFSEEFENINQLYQNYVTTLREKGNPFLDSGMSKQELKDLASQLRKPNGDKGIQIGNMMNETNISMTRKTLEHCSVLDNEQILEIGHGNANHLIEILNKASNLRYFGLDISELMNKEAEKFSKENFLDSKSKFQLYDGTNIPFPNNSFDKIFTVNTIYFWHAPNALMKELHRVLKPGGILCITFVDEETMSKLTFTDFGFTKYNQEKFEKLIENIKFNTTIYKQYSEMIKSKMLGEIERKYWVMTLTKGMD